MVLRRVEELREQRGEGLQTLSEFVDRRLAPAMRTCEAVAERLETLSPRVARARQLLRARAVTNLEGPNLTHLEALHRRPRLAPRIPQPEVGRASVRARVGQYVCIWV